MQRIGKLLAGTGLVLMSSSALLGADRMVIVEDFNATWCGPCVPVGRALNDLQADYLSDVIVIQVHQADAYETEWGTARANFYSVPGFPLVWFDGVDERLGTAGEDADYVAFVGMLENRLDTPTDVIVEATSTPQGGDDYQIDVFIGIEPGGTEKSMRLHIAQYLDNTPTGSHYLNCFMQANEYETITVAPGEWTTVSHTFTLTGESVNRLGDVRFIAWAQSTNGSGPSEIYNADRSRLQPAQMGSCCLNDGEACFSSPMSFCNALGGAWTVNTECSDSPCVEIECPADADGDSVVGFSDLLLMLTDWGPCVDCPLDLDGDDVVGFQDLLMLLNSWGPCS